MNLETLASLIRQLQVGQSIEIATTKKGTEYQTHFGIKHIREFDCSLLLLCSFGGYGDSINFPTSGGIDEIDEFLTYMLKDEADYVDGSPVIYFDNIKSNVKYKITITTSEYYKLHKDLRGIWTTKRTDLPNWNTERNKYMGKRTMLTNQNGATVLLVEGMGFEITEDDYYTKKFICGKHSISRIELESLPSSFCTDDATDSMMQNIINKIVAETNDQMCKIYGENYSSHEKFSEKWSVCWIKALEDVVIEAGIPYYEDIKTHK